MTALFLEQAPPPQILFRQQTGGIALSLNLLGFNGLTQNHLHGKVDRLGAACPWPLQNQGDFKKTLNHTYFYLMT